MFRRSVQGVNGKVKEVCLPRPAIILTRFSQATIFAIDAGCAQLPRDFLVGFGMYSEGERVRGRGEMTTSTSTYSSQGVEVG